FDHGLPVLVNAFRHLRITKAREIGEYGLSLPALPFAPDVVEVYQAGSPRSAPRPCDLPRGERVEQRGFPHVGPSDKTNLRQTNGLSLIDPGNAPDKTCIDYSHATIVNVLTVLD